MKSIVLNEKIMKCRKKEIEELSKKIMVRVIRVKRCYKNKGMIVEILNKNDRCKKEQRSGNITIMVIKRMEKC